MPSSPANPMLHGRTPTRASTASTRIGVHLIAVLLAACTDPLAVPDRPARAARVSSLSVTSADPTSAPQDTTLDVRVLGSGFDSGSRAEWALAGVIDPAKVRTNSTTYVSASELRVNITISLDAAVASYDIIVTTSTGKKGIGTEKFAVRGKQAVDPGLTPTGTLESPASTITSVNSLGWMSGIADGTPRRGFVVAPGTTSPVLLPAPGAGNYDAWGIADNNIIAGIWGGAAFIWRPTESGEWRVEFLVTPDGMEARGKGARLNRSGTLGVRGVSPTGTLTSTVPVLWDLTMTPASVQSLRVPSDAIRGIAETVNDAGLIVGWVTRSDGSTYSVVWPNADADAIALPTYPGASSQSASEMNNAGYIAGRVTLPVTKRTTASYIGLWKPSASGTYDTAPEIISPQGAANPYINDAGDVVYRGADDAVYLRRLTGSTIKLGPLPGAYEAYFANSVGLPHASGAAVVVGHTNVAAGSGTGYRAPTIWTVP